MAYKGKIKDGFLLQRIKAPEITSVLAHAASLMLTGVPPSVCECVLTEMYSSVKKIYFFNCSLEKLNGAAQEFPQKLSDRLLQNSVSGTGGIAGILYV